MHDDGDEEDLDLEEVIEAIAEHQRALGELKPFDNRKHILLRAGFDFRINDIREECTRLLVSFTHFK